MKKKNKILFICKKNEFWSKKILNLLKKNFANIQIHYSEKHNEKIPKKIFNWKGDFIFCFRSYLILNKKVIKNARIAAINFHPGPPDYRGIGCVNYAIHNNEKYYGATAHLISKKIDSGKILCVRNFKINKNDKIDDILFLTYKNLYELIVKIVKLIKNEKLNLSKLIEKNQKYKWSKVIKSLKDLNRFYEIKKNISKVDLKKKLRATITKNFKPYIVIHNKKFIYSDEE